MNWKNFLVPFQKRKTCRNVMTFSNIYYIGKCHNIEMGKTLGEVFPCRELSPCTKPVLLLLKTFNIYSIVQIGTGKVDPARKLKCTTTAGVKPQ